MPAADVALAACYGGPCAAFRATPPGLFTPVTPYRLFDTRDASLNPFGTATAVQPGQTLAVDLSGQPGPPDRKAVLLNVTTDQPARRRLRAGVPVRSGTEHVDRELRPGPDGRQPGDGDDP